LRILERLAAVLKGGHRIVELETSESLLAVDRLAQNLALKENQQEKTRLDLERSLNDLDSQARIKDLQLQSFRSQLARSQALWKEGLISVEQLRQAELAEAQAVIELKKIQNERENAQRATRAQFDALALEIATVRKETQEARRQLNLAAPKASRRGVLTWSLNEEGVAVHKGDVLARIADLSSFRVEATLSDVHAKNVSVGLPVAVKVGEQTLDATLSNVLPTIRNGVMTVQVALRQKSSPLLRSNLRVDVFIVTGRRARALRVRKGPFADGEGPVDAFVVRGDRAQRTRIELGLSSFEEFEVVKGLAAGDEVVISDMKDFMHLREVRIR
jgi:HlyD family secretion protein